MTEGQSNQITNDAPKMSSLFPCTCYIIVFRVGIKGNNSTNTFPPYKQKPQGTKDVRIKFMFFSIFFIPIWIIDTLMFLCTCINKASLI